jgi:hypothetical protein
MNSFPAIFISAFYIYMDFSSMSVNVTYKVVGCCVGSCSIITNTTVNVISKAGHSFPLIVLLGSCSWVFNNESILWILSFKKYVITSGVCIVFLFLLPLNLYLNLSKIRADIWVGALERSLSYTRRLSPYFVAPFWSIFEYLVMKRRRKFFIQNAPNLSARNGRSGCCW